MRIRWLPAWVFTFAVLRCAVFGCAPKIHENKSCDSRRILYLVHINEMRTARRARAANPKRKLTIMKTTPSTNESAASAPTAQPITSGTVKALIMETATQLGMKVGDPKASCSGTQYGLILFIVLHKLGLVPREVLPAMEQAWTYYPKNPSAFAQLLQKTDEGATSTSGASALLSKYLGAPDAE